MRYIDKRENLGIVSLIIAGVGAALSVGGTIHKGYKDSETLKDIRRQEEEQLEKMQQQKAIEQAKLYDNIKKYAPIIAIGGAGLIGSILVLK